MRIQIEKLKGINKIDIDLPINPGTYAITGQNGCGKSSLMDVISKLFYDDVFNTYFHKAKNGAKVEFE